MADGKSIVVCVSREGMGQAEGELSMRLLGNFLHALETEQKLPTAICFFAEGVRLVLDDSPVLPYLHTLQALGVRLLVCRTCLDYYGVADRVAAGTIGNMAGIVTAMFEADSVITL